MAITSYLRPAPVFFAAAGAATGFYFIFPLINNKLIQTFSYTSIILFFVLAITIVVLCRTFVIFCRYASKIDFRFKMERRIQLVSICIVVFIVGLVAGFEASVLGQPGRRHFAVLQDKVDAIEGVLTEDPRIISGGSAMANVSLRGCAQSDPYPYKRVWATASGDITVFFPQTSAEKLREFGRGTTVFLEGSFRKSGGSLDNDTFSATSVHIVKQASKIERTRTGVRLRLIERAEGKEWGGLAIALLLGIKDNLDSDLAAMYRKAGSSYILALSGMHLAVLAALISFMLKPVLGLKPASIVGAVIIILYCFLVGPMPSLYRAALMYLLGVVAIFGFLPRQPLAILSLSFLIQIIVTPNAGHSISFMLSYLALFGIFVIGQALYELFAGKMPDFIMQPVSASCGAFLATAGITGSVFGYLAPIGIIIGLVLVPLTTLYMILSILWLALGNLLADNLLTIPLSLLYKLMEAVVSMAAKVPAISAARPGVFVALSIIIPILIIVLEYKQRQSRLKMEAFI